MEKIVCALWMREGDKPARFTSSLLTSLAPTLAAAGARHIRVNLRDEVVAPAAPLSQRWQSPQQDAVVQFWLPTANALFRASVDSAVAAHCGRFAAWLVSESTIISNDSHPPVAGQRTWGWSQASFISFRRDIGKDAARAIWQSHHTRVAIDTQANFEYVQNHIVAPLTDDAPDYDAFVEECFPLDAMTDPSCFFDAVGNPARYDAHLALMMDSCSRFIDFSRIDIIPTSQYDF